jgi:hypothetical protein
MFKIFDHRINVEREATPEEVKLYFSGPSKEELSTYYKNERNILLLQSDWTQLPDVNIDSEKAQQWKYYRQKLRDITTQSGFPYQIEWPILPGDVKE